MTKDQFNNLTDEEQETIKDHALRRTAHNFLIFTGLCTNCFKAYIVSGYICSECGFDKYADTE